MSSPVFGKPDKKAPSFQRSPPENTASAKEVQYVLALLQLTKNIKKIASSVKRIEYKYKRSAFAAMKFPNGSANKKFISQKEFICLLEVQRKLVSLYQIVASNTLKAKIGGWQALKAHNAVEVEEEKRSNTLPRDRMKPRNKKTEEWKQNSSYNNVLDLSSENKRLKMQISKEQSENQSFIQKMNAVLDQHEKPKGPSRKRK